MKKLLVMCSVLAVFAVSAIAVEGTVETLEKRQSETNYQTMAIGELGDLLVSLKAEGIDLTGHPAMEAYLSRIAENRGERVALDQGADACPATVIAGLPYSDAGTTIGQTNDYSFCSMGSSPDVIYTYTPIVTELVELSLCGGSTYDTRLTVRRDGACPGTTQVGCNDDACGLLSRLTLTLDAGVQYWIVVAGYSSASGNYTLDIGPPPPLGRCCYNQNFDCVDLITEDDCIYGFGGDWTVGLTCNDPCPPPPPIGRCCYDIYCGDMTENDCINFYNGAWDASLTCANDACPPPPPPPGALRVILVPVPSGLGVSISADCRGDLYYTNYGEGILYRMDDFGVLLDSDPIVDASGSPRYIDEMGWDEGNQQFWGGELNTNAIWTVDRNGLATYQFPGMGGYTLTDGCDYDGTDNTIWHSTDVSSVITHFSNTGLLLGTLTLLDEFGNPEGVISGVELGAANTIWAGNSPIDDVRRCNKSTGVFVSRFDAGQVRCEGMECDAITFAPQTVLWVKDAYNNTVTAFEIEAGTCVCAELPDTCQFPYEEVDHGDLTVCNYPTMVGNPAHGLSGIAWLGALVDGEAAPEILNADQLPEDDGVTFIGLPWTPCTVEDLRVTVTAGPEYGRYEQCGGRLYLNAWKDGNADGDFCDEIPCVGAVASEWIIRDALVTPGAWPFSVLDPGVLDIGVYDGLFRFRLTSTPVGRFGFGLAVAGACTEQCGTFAFDYLGEVEDYIIADGQLQVELASFDVVAGSERVSVNWSTASETDNHHFVIERDGVQVAEVSSLGNTASGHSYSWVDNNVVNGTTYSYSLIAVDVNGARELMASETATPRANSGVVSEYSLHQNFPNPFNPSTSIRFDLVEAGVTTLKVYNVQGQEVATLVNGMQNAGSHTVSFNATGLPSGLYVYSLEVNGFKAEGKMLLMK